MREPYTIGGNLYVGFNKHRKQKRMRCPACKTRLKSIQPGEWACPNTDCPERDRYQSHLDVEWYGSTQKEINEMYQNLHRQSNNSRKVEE